MKILCVGDIVGKPGRYALEGLLNSLRTEHAIDFVIVNAENSAGGSGLTSRIADELLGMGCDVLTLGDHVWDQKDLQSYLDKSDSVIRPYNFPEEVPGKGWCIKTTAGGIKVGVINLLGRVFMRYQVSCPFRALSRAVDEIKKETPIIIVDMHAETTSEKTAMGHFSNGKVSAVFGTHTHIQTADEKVLSEGTAYISDLGMTGPYESIIGQDKDIILKRFLTSMPIKFHVAEGDVRLCGMILDVDEATGKSRSIVRVQQPFSYQTLNKQEKN